MGRGRPRHPRSHRRLSLDIVVRDRVVSLVPAIERSIKFGSYKREASRMNSGAAVMKSVWNGLKEIYGLFVDDGWLSLEICLWLLAVWLLLPRAVESPSVRAIILFIGLAVLLLGSVSRGLRAGR
jgi:hypothetical protein